MAKNKNMLIVMSLLLILVLTFLGFKIINNRNNKNVKELYTISFNSMGGNSVASLSVEEGGKISKPVDPIREGYVFIRWEYGNQLYDFSTPVSGNVVLYARWQKKADDKKTFIVKFDTDGGNTIANQIVEENQLVTKPEEPKKNGYKFVKWVLNDKEYDFNSKVTQDITLKVVWEKEKVNNTSSNTNNNTSTNTKPSTPTVTTYTVKFNSDGGSSVANQTVKDGEKAVKPANPTKNGYIFEGWTLNNNNYDFNTKVTANITLVAKWKEVQVKNYTVSFNSNGGSSVANQTIAEGNKVTRPANPTREGYNFVSWTLNGSEYNFDTSVNGDVTLTATWNQRRYTIGLTKVDKFSLDYIVHVYDDTGSEISVSQVQYNDGTLLCSGSNMTVNMDDIGSENSFVVTLTGGTKVTASLE